MESNTAEVLCDKEVPTPRRLRQPHKSPSAIVDTPDPLSDPSRSELLNTTNSSSNNLVNEDIVKKSRLSVDAPEFVPSFMQTPPTPSGSNQILNKATSVQNRLKRHKEPEWRLPPYDYEGDGIDNDFIGSTDDKRLTYIIDTLTKNPEQFNDLCELFMDTLDPYFGNILVLSRAADLLVLKATEQTGFGYTGAKLCCLLEQCCPEFRAQLHLTCKRELERNANKSGLLMFVAELYTQLHHENLYGTYLIDAFMQLLTLGGNDNVKCVCQALKLTGYSLELYNKDAVDEVFMKLQQVKPTVTGTSLSLINSVVNLRSMNWGHTSSSNSNISLEEQPYWGEINTPMFDPSDGSKFSAEENAFLAEHFKAPDEYMADFSDPDELCDPEPEMDEEIQAAFRDFVKLGKR